MRAVLFLVSILALSACTGGQSARSGSSQQETAPKPETGISVSGYARYGVVWD